MKFAVVLVCLSVAVLVAMIFQAVRQEMKLRSVKNSMVVNSADVKKKEHEIVEVKGKIEELKKALGSVNTKMEDLKKKKENIIQSTKTFSSSLLTCDKEKVDAQNKKKEVAGSITKLKADQEKAKSKAETNIQSLKQQILDRDKAICAFADTTKEEARKLCGITS